MSETNILNASNIKVTYIVTENGLNKNNTYKPCSVLTINATNNENIQLLQIPDNNKPVTINQPVKVLNVAKSKNNDEVTAANSKSNIIYRVLRPEDLDLKVPTPEDASKPVKRGKQKKLSIDEETEEKEINEIPKKIFRTRSGRMSKPPKYIQEEELPQIIINTVSSNSTEQKPEPEPSVEPKLNTELFEKKSVPENKPKTVEYKRNISSQHRCGTCKKAYLGQNKMLKHLQLNPGHVAPDFSKKSNDFNMWSELLKKTKMLPVNQQSQLFCKELINLIHKAKSVIPKLIKPAIKEENSNFNVDSIISNALGIPEGNYSFDETVSVCEVANSVNDDNKNSFDELKKMEECIQNTESDVQNNDQNSLLNLLDTGQVTFDSSSNSEEVMNVDQLVNERLKTLTGGEIESPNNGTQNLSLDLSLDMFSYHGS